jgi:hypothetical protein
VLKKVFGLLFLAAIGVAGFVLWQNPDMLDAVVAWVQSFMPD